MMKKFLYLLIFATIITGCKFEDTGYSFVREYDDGTYLTKRGTAAYVSGIADTATRVGDNFAIVEELITHVNNLEDSILIYGHCWSTSPAPSVVDTLSTRFMIDENADGRPDRINDSLYVGRVIESYLTGLIPDTKYYLRSYIITGNTDAGVNYADTAFNPAELVFKTEVTNNNWKPKADNVPLRGGISFSYKGDMYAGLGRDYFETKDVIRKYDPITDQWSDFAWLPVKLSDAWCFVIENVVINNVSRDYLYIGGGYSDLNSKTPLQPVYRMDLSCNEGNSSCFKQMSNLSQFLTVSTPKNNAIGFTVNGFGYVAFGEINGGAYTNDVVRLTPALEVYDGAYPQGKWDRFSQFPGEGRTGCSSFVIDHSVFVYGGQEKDGTYPTSLWMFRPNDIAGSWVQKAECPAPGRTEGVGFAIDDEGFIGTGENADGYLNDFWRYNAYLNVWDQRADYSGEPRSEAVGEGIEISTNRHRGFVGTGGTGVDGELEFGLSFWMYTP